MKICSIVDFKDIIHLIKDEDITKYQTFLLSEGCYIFTNKDYTAISTYVQLNTHSLEAHVESSKECRGYKLKKFLIDSGKEAFILSGCSSVLNFVDKDNKALLLFSGTFAERVGEINDKVLFVTERKRYL